MTVLFRDDPRYGRWTFGSAAAGMDGGSGPQPSSAPGRVNSNSIPSIPTFTGGGGTQGRPAQAGPQSAGSGQVTNYAGGYLQGGVWHPTAAGATQPGQSGGAPGYPGTDSTPGGQMRYWEPQVRAGVSESVNRRGLGRSNIPEQMANEQLAAIWARLIGGQQAQQFQASQAELNRQYGSAESAAAAARQAELERYRAELNQYYNAGMGPQWSGTGINQLLDNVQANQTMAAGGSGSPTLGQSGMGPGGTRYQGALGGGGSQQYTPDGYAYDTSGNLVWIGVTAGGQQYNPDTSTADLFKRFNDLMNPGSASNVASNVGSHVSSAMGYRG